MTDHGYRLRMPTRTIADHGRRAEFAGTLLGFDDYVNMVLEDVTELYVTPPSNPSLHNRLAR